MNATRSEAAVGIDREDRCLIAVLLGLAIFSALVLTVGLRPTEERVVVFTVLFSFVLGIAIAIRAVVQGILYWRRRRRNAPDRRRVQAKELLLTLGVALFIWGTLDLLIYYYQGPLVRDAYRTYAWLYGIEYPPHVPIRIAAPKPTKSPDPVVKKAEPSIKLNTGIPNSPAPEPSPRVIVAEKPEVKEKKEPSVVAVIAPPTIDAGPPTISGRKLSVKEKSDKIIVVSDPSPDLAERMRKYGLISPSRR